MSVLRNKKSCIICSLMEVPQIPRKRYRCFEESHREDKKQKKCTRPLRLFFKTILTFTTTPSPAIFHQCELINVDCNYARDDVTNLQKKAEKPWFKFENKIIANIVTGILHHLILFPMRISWPKIKNKWSIQVASPIAQLKGHH